MNSIKLQPKQPQDSRFSTLLSFNSDINLFSKRKNSEGQSSYSLIEGLKHKDQATVNSPTDTYQLNE